MFIEDLWFSHELKQVELFGHTVMQDHVHILFEPLGKSNHSEVIGSLNLVLGQPFVRNLDTPMEGDDSNAPGADGSNHRLRRNFQFTKQRHPHLTFDAYKDYLDRLESIRRNYETNCTPSIDLPHFRWQKSFCDHLIRDRRDFDNHIVYIYNNATKHELSNAPDTWPWMWIMGMPSPLRHGVLIH